mgnify:CR=1 FL=1
MNSTATDYSSVTEMNDFQPDSAPAGSVALSVRDRIAFLSLGTPEESAVALTLDRIESLENVLNTLEKEVISGTIVGAVISGPNPRMFCAGADLKLLHLIQEGNIPAIQQQLLPAKHITVQERELLETLSIENLVELGEQLSLRGKRIFGRIRSLPVRTVAAVSGTCLGGGLELAMHCDYIIAAKPGSIFSEEYVKTELGFPEPLLGILEGWGGTELTVRRIGLPAALRFTMQGKSLAPGFAKKLGVIDEVVPAKDLLIHAEAIARGQVTPRRRLPLGDRFLTFTTLGRKLVRDGLSLPFAGKLIPGVKDSLKNFPIENYPAPHAIVEVTLHGLNAGFQAGSQLSSKRFGELMTSSSSKAMVHSLFFGTEAAKAHGRHSSRSVKALNCVVVGAGQMGTGIAHALARAGHKVTLQDTYTNALDGARTQITDWIGSDKKLHNEDKHQMVQNLSFCDNLSQIGVPVDFAIEAVVEKEEVKKTVLGSLSKVVSQEGFIATNTSSIPIQRLISAVAQPEHFFGLHYFNPVQQMRLVEVISGNQTSESAVQFGAALASGQGKYPIVVGDVPGFLINRLLAPYLNEAVRMVLEGYPIDAIDQAAVQFGMFMGPLKTLDLVGLDVGGEVATVLSKGYPDRMQPPSLPSKGGDEVSWQELQQAMADRNLLGKKSGRGFYIYDQQQGKSKKPLVNPMFTDPAFWEEAGAIPPHKQTTDGENIAERLVLSLVNEAVRCVDEGVAGSPGPDAALQLDLGSVMGFGFAPFRGGVIYYADSRGAANIYDALKRLESKHGTRFQPCDGIVERSNTGQHFSMVTQR